LSNKHVTTYSDWEAASGPLWRIDALFKATQRPGAGSYYYYARQGRLEGGDIWYMGLQTSTRPFRERGAVFAVWHAVDGTNPDKYIEEFQTEGESNIDCELIDENGAVWTCHIPYDWQAGRTYRLHIEDESDDWWGAYVKDESTGEQRLIGRIRARTGQGHLHSHITDFVEYYGGDFDKCGSLWPSRVTFLAPAGNGGSVHFNATGNHIGPGDCNAWRSSWQTSDYAEHFMGMDGPYFIKSLLKDHNLGHQLCLDAGGGIGTFTYLRNCNFNNANHRWWRHANGGLAVDIVSENFPCLDANTGHYAQHTYMRACNHHNSNLRWTRKRMNNANSYQIVSETPGKRCLDANTGQFGSETYMRSCDSGENLNLQWLFESPWQGSKIVSP
jgi:hypothetical protein